MSDFSFTVAFLLPAKAEHTKNFRELQRYAHSMGFRILLSRCLNDSKLLLRAFRLNCGPLEVASLFIALHLLAAQRREDLILVGRIDGRKYEHRLFATLSIEKIADWSHHLMKRLISGESPNDGPFHRPGHREKAGPLKIRRARTPRSETRTPVAVFPRESGRRVLH
jgi:hypothetical protein